MFLFTPGIRKDRNRKTRMTQNKMTDFSTKISIITLNVNGQATSMK